MPASTRSQTPPNRCLADAEQPQLMAAARRIQSTALAASTAVSRRIQTTVLGASIAAGSHPLMSQDMFPRLRHQEIRTVFGLLRQTCFCLQQRHVCASSSSNKDITASASELIKAQKGSSTEVLSLGCVKGASTAVWSHPLISQNLLLPLPRQEIRTVFGLLQQTYLCLQQRPVCAFSSNKDVAIGKTTASASVGNTTATASEVLVDSGSLKQLERRILRLEVRSRFYKNFKWVFVGPIVGTLMAISSAINTYHDVSTAKEKQKNTAEKLSNLKRQIEYLEGRIN